jgi:PAS domain S-box-containing protein
MKPPPLDNEIQRLQALHRLGVLDTAADPLLDSFTELAASITDTPISLISLVDHDRQWWKSAVGLPQGAQTSRDISFCGHVIASDALFEVEDARLDQRFADNPMVTGKPHVIHFAGMPLVLPGGERIGSLDVIEHTPGRLDAAGRTLLEKMSKSIVEVLLLRESEYNLKQRLKAATLLHESEARFKTITEALPQLVWSALPDGQTDYFNQRWYEYTGTAPDSNLGAWTDLVHPADQPQVIASWSRSCSSGEPYEIDCRLRHHSGEYRWILGRALPVTDEAGRIRHWMGTCTDIHDNKVAQQQLAAANQRKDEFLAMLAHELRNPLAPISSAVQTLALVADEPARVRNLSGLIKRQVKHMTAIVDDLLDVSRVDRGLVEIAHKVVDLQQVLKSAAEQVMPLVQERQHELQLRTGKLPVHVMGDQVRLVQIVSNLLQNAAKYTPPGGRILLELSTDQQAACIKVSDNGNGIAAGLLPHVFELFTQGSRTPDRAQGGLGLGLGLVRSVVELHGGSVDAYSGGAGQGSTFTVLLPLAHSDQASAEPAPAVPQHAARSLHIMVVDDNADAASTLGQWLELEGHRVSVQFGARQAMAASGLDPAEVYLLDIGLPDLDGYKLARQIRNNPANEHATLIAVTGYGQAQDVALSQQAGFQHHFVKPVDPAALTAVLVRLAQEQPA